MKLSKFFIIIVIGVVGVQSVIAQTEKLGAVSYVPPKGFTKSAQEQHAVIFSAMDQAKPLANTIADWASVAALTGFIVCLAAPLRGRKRPQAEGMAAPSRASAASS